MVADHFKHFGVEPNGLVHVPAKPRHMVQSHQRHLIMMMIIIITFLFSSIAHLPITKAVEGLGMGVVTRGIKICM